MQRILAAAQGSQGFLLELQAFGDLILPFDVLQRIAVNNSLVVELAQVLQDAFELSKMLLPQRSVRIEIPGREFYEARRWRG